MQKATAFALLQGLSAANTCAKSIEQNGAGDAIRTRDIQLGRLALYQLSYTRLGGGERWIRTIEGKTRQIYSLLPLATRQPRLKKVELVIGLEPTTTGLQNRCSTN